MDKPSEQMRKALLNSKYKTVRELLEIIPVDCVYALIYNLGGCTISLPRISSFTAAERNNRIIQEYLSGKTLNELAKKYELSVRQINHIINEKDN